jgi:pimeloyl-ACP methyl ester carboxylesterase
METLDVRGISVDAHIAGSGPPLLFLHAEQLFAQTLPHLETLAKRWRVIAPQHPGFGARPLPEDFRTVDDLAYFYLDLLDVLDAKKALVVGASFGGWVALEMAVRNTKRIGRLALIGPVGVKLSGREERDLADLFYLPDGEAFATLFADAAPWAPRYAELDLAAVEAIARERQAMAHYAWKPYLHNPGLKRWLHRIDVPTLVLWGEKDRFATPAYGHKLAERIPGADFKMIAMAGHYPHIEQSEQVVKAVEAFASR